MKKTIVLFPGSYNPFHQGHFNILEKAEKIFGEGSVRICLGVNPDKINSDKKEEYLKELESKCLLLEQKIFKNKLQKSSEKVPVKTPVEFYSGFLHDHVSFWENKGFNVVVVRGLRNGDDLDYEVNQMRFIEDFKKGVSTTFIVCDKEYEHISSSSIRKLEQFAGPDSVKKYLL